jgi:hypothetical protein
MAPENLAGPSDFKAFRHRFLCFASRNRLWHKEPGKYALDRTWQEEFGVMRAIASRERNNSHKERKDHKSKDKILFLGPSAVGGSSRTSGSEICSYQSSSIGHALFAMI